MKQSKQVLLKITTYVFKTKFVSADSLANASRAPVNKIHTKNMTIGKFNYLILLTSQIVCCFGKKKIVPNYTSL